MSLIVTDALVTLAACDFEKLVQFYQQFLCQEPTVYRANSYAEFRLSGLKLGIFRPKAGLGSGGARATGIGTIGGQASRGQGNPGVSQSQIQNRQFPTGMALCLEVGNLETTIAHLSNLGYPASSEIITASHGREIYAYDPERNWLILHEAYQQA